MRRLSWERRRPARKALSFAVLLLVGCGGVDVVEGTGGAGPQGATAESSTTGGGGGSGGAPSSSESASTGVTECSCEDACQALDACEFLHGPDCVSFCEDLTPERRACFCAIGSSCNDIAGCVTL